MNEQLSFLDAEPKLGDWVIRRERPVHVEQLRSAKLYELANLIEGRKYY